VESPKRKALAILLRKKKGHHPPLKADEFLIASEIRRESAV